MLTNTLKTKAERDFVTSLLISKYYKKNEERLLDEALMSLLSNKENLRKEVAIDAYREKKVSLWRAAEIAEVSLEYFKSLLADRNVKIISS